MTRSGGVAGAASDGWVMAKRNLIKIKRVPDILVFVLISPIMFVLLFAYVFGGAIDVPGNIDYKEFLVPGIFAQTVVFGATFTGYGLADDMQKGIIDRFRSLPMSQSAVLIGRTTSDVAYNVISLVIMALTGLLVGWRIREGLARRAARLPAAAGVRLRDQLDHGLRRAAGAERRGRQQRLVHRDHAADVRLQRVRAADVLRRRAQDVRRVEPGVHASPRPAASCSATSTRPSRCRTPGRCRTPSVYTLLWSAAIVAVFAPLSVRQYRLSAKK